MKYVGCALGKMAGQCLVLLLTCLNLPGQTDAFNLGTPDPPGQVGKIKLPEAYWAGQRTLYALSTDLKTFSQPPQKLFDADWDLATIDTIVRRFGDRYYAIIKDERYPTLAWPTGKTIRLCAADSLTGPYSRPGPPVSPNFREAPMVIPSPDGQAWYLYFEQYPGIAYGLSVATDPAGPWLTIAGNQRPDWDKFRVPTAARHGCMLVISQPEYERLRKAFRQQ